MSLLTHFESGLESDFSRQLPILPHFNQRYFADRMNRLVRQTRQYEGALPIVWSKIVRENGGSRNGQRSDGGIDGSPHGSDDHIHHLVRRIRNAGVTSVVLEAAHAYLYQSMDDPGFVWSLETQFSEARKLSGLLAQNRIDVRRVLFVDNYNPNPATGVREKNLNISAYKDLARDCGYRPDYLMWEADMVPLSKAMIDFMRRCQALVSEAEKQGGAEKEAGNISEGKKLMLDHRGIDLLSIDEDKVSCSALDAALSIVKYRYLGQGIVNVLPKRQQGSSFSFRGQQKKVRQILADHLGVRVLPFFNVFTHDREIESSSSGAHHELRKPHHL